MMCRWCLGRVSVMCSDCIVMFWWYVGDALVLCWWCLCSVSVMLWCLSDGWWCCGDRDDIVMFWWWILMNILRFTMGSEEKRVAVRCVFAIGVVCWANFSNIFRPKNFVLARPKYFVGFKLETIFFGPFCQSTRMLLHTHLCIRVSFVFVNAQCTSGIMINGLTIGRNQEKWRSFSAKNQASQIGVNSMLRLKGSCQLKWCGRIRI